MKYRPDDDFRKHLNAQGLRGKRFNLDSVEHLELVDKFRDWHPNETPEELHQRAVYALLWKDKKKHNAKWYLKWLAIGAALLLLILAGSSKAEAQVDCVKWQASDASTVGNFCAPFKVKAGTNVTFSKNGTTLTVDVSSAGIAGRPYVDAKTDCSLAGDNVTDDGPTINTCITNNQGKTIFFPKTQANGVCDYYSTQTIVIKGKGTVLLGAGSGWPNANTSLGNSCIRFAANTQGIYIGLENTAGPAVRGLGLLGGNETRNIQVPSTFLIPSAAKLPHYNRNISSIQRASNVLTVTVSPTTAGDRLTAQVGSTVAITGVAGDSSLNGNCDIATTSGPSMTGGAPGTFTCAQNGTDSGPFTSDGVLKLPTTSTNDADGIRVCTNFVILDNVTVQGFARWGVNADSTAGNGCVNVFSDDLIIQNSFITNNQYGGIFCRGVDCNAGKFSGNSIYYNGIIGAEDMSSLGNEWDANQFSYNDYLNGSTASPTTKNISTIARTLSGSDSTVTVVLSAADTNIRLGSCIVIAGVTDSSFNTPAGQCYFVTVFTDSTHYQYIQSGAPADASSSGGTSRIGKYGEATLSSGVFYGSIKIGFGSGSSDGLTLHNYIEGGQPCAFGTSTIMIQGTSTPTCATYADQRGSFIGTQYFTAGAFGSNLTHLGNRSDSSYEMTFHAGSSVSQSEYLTWDTYNNLRAWRLDVSNTGTLGANGYWHLTSDGTNQSRIVIFGSNNGGHSDLSAAGTGAVRFGRNFAGTNAGTGGVEFYSGGSSPAKVASISSTGLVTVGSTTVGSLPSAASNPGAMIRVSDSTTVSAEGQTCVGSSSNNALAFSNGSLWKCF